MGETEGLDYKRTALEILSGILGRRGITMKLAPWSAVLWRETVHARFAGSGRSGGGSLSVSTC